MSETVLAWFLAGLTAAATAYYLAVLAACAKLTRRSNTPLGDAPPVSILKPVRGLDPRFEESLRAHQTQDYPSFEVVMGIADGDDPAVPVARRLGVEPVICGEGDAGNRKAAILERLVSSSRHDILMVDDADVLPEPDWLTRTVAELQRPGVGIVSCLYRTRPGRTLGSKIDALHVSVDFPGQALAGAELAGIPFALGAAMLFRREDLDRIGGFKAIRDYLADDYQLGARIAGLGKRAVLSPSVVETVAGEASLRDVWERHLRWSRTVRVSRPGGHFGLIVTFGTVWSSTLLAVGGLQAPWIWIAGCCLAARCAAAAGIARTVNACLGASWLLLPAADLWAFAVWTASFFGSTVRWRGRSLRLDGEGRIVAAK